MKVDELVKKYSDSRKMKKEYDFNRHIIRSYLPYAEKCALAKGVVEATSFEEVNGVRIYKRNTKSMLFIFTMKLVEKYTDIEINVADITNEYDALMASGAMNGLMSEIPEEEISILRGMVDMERDDLEINSHSLVAFFESKSDAISLMFEAFLKGLENQEMIAALKE